MNVLALRFPGFKGEWVESRLGQLANVVSGLTYSPADVRDEGLLVLRSSNIKDGEIVLEDCVFVDPKIKGANLSQPGDILICVRNGSTRLIGKNSVLPQGLPLATHGAFMTVLRAKDTSFLAQLLKSDDYQSQVAADLGARINSINSGQLKRYRFHVPSLNEQKKIAAFLGVVDAKIAALRARVAGLERYKRGLMQALFSQTLRFTKPDGTPFPDWEEKRLGEVFEEVMEKVGDQDFPTFSISAGKGWVSQKEKFGKDISGQQNQRYTALRVGDFSYNKGNSKSFKYGCIYPNDTGATIAVPNVFISFRAVDTDTSAGFYAKLFENHFLDRGLRRLISSGARMDGLLNVNKGQFFKLKIPQPYPDEQAKIAEALSAMDAKITAVTEQLDQMQDFKKGLLQQMFV